MTFANYINHDFREFTMNNGIPNNRADPDVRAAKRVMQ